MDEKRLRTYALLARLPFPKSYVGKMLLVALLGIHVPLIALVLCLVLYSPSDCGDAMGVLAAVLLATLLGADATLRVLYLLLEPVSLASKALRDYADHGKMTDLPIWFTGPAGRLMADVQYAVEHLDNVIRSLKEGSTKDYLTGAYNRRAAEERLAADLARAERDATTLTFGVIDRTEARIMRRPL